MAVLAVADDLAGDRALATQQAAQLADDPVRAPVVEMDVLAGQRRAPAVGAALAVGLERAEAAAQQVALELLDVDRRRAIDSRVSPSGRRLLPVPRPARSRFAPGSSNVARGIRPTGRVERRMPIRYPELPIALDSLVMIATSFLRDVGAAAPGSARAGREEHSMDSLSFGHLRRRRLVPLRTLRLRADARRARTR